MRKSSSEAAPECGTSSDGAVPILRKAFRGDAIFAIEEPEFYLHPHAQRSLAALFEELATAGNQVFYSTHSAKSAAANGLPGILIGCQAADRRSVRARKQPQK